MPSSAPARLLAIGAALALIALVVIGLIELGGSSSSTSSGVRPSLSLAQIDARLAGSPAPLASLHAQASEVLTGGSSAVRARIASLRGYPIVINKWASWCGPCRSERDAFEQASVTYGRSVAFLGIDSGDVSLADGRSFVLAVPVAYPSYYDRSGQIGTALADSSFTPVTVFYDRSGHEFIHQGPYPSAAKLQADVRRYALDQ